VLAGDGGVFGAGDEGGADLRVAVGGDAHADAAGADEDAKVGLARDHFVADQGGEVGVIDRFRSENAEISDEQPFAGEVSVDVLFQFKPAVVGSDGDAEGRVVCSGTDRSGHGLVLGLILVEEF